MMFHEHDHKRLHLHFSWSSKKLNSPLLPEQNALHFSSSYDPGSKAFCQVCITLFPTSFFSFMYILDKKSCTLSANKNALSIYICFLNFIGLKLRYPNSNNGPTIRICTSTSHITNLGLYLTR